MPQTLKGARSLGATLLLTLGTFGVAQAQIIVNPAVTFASGLYHYDYTVTNKSGADLFELDIKVLPDATAGFAVIRNLAAAPGFVTGLDSVNGIVSFLEDTGTFGTTPQNGFVFDSPIAPSGSTFTANLAPANPGDPIPTQTGSTSAPTTPEPGSMAAFGALAVSGLVAARRKSRRK